MGNAESKQDKPIIQYILVGLLIITTALGIFLVSQNQNLKTDLLNYKAAYDLSEVEKGEVIDDLKVMAGEYDSLITDNDSINVELMEQKDKVDKLLSDAKKYNWSIYKLKKEASTLRRIMKGYVRTIDSLNTENVALQTENLNVKGQLTVKEQENNALRVNNSTLESKVRLGAKLVALNLTAEAQRIKRNNIHKPTTRASNTQIVRACFTVIDNEVTEPGKKMVYLRIVTPEGPILAERSTNSNTFLFEEERLLYSVKKEINYENEQLDLCMYWNVNNILNPGEYHITAYIEGYIIGEVTLLLK